jgi:hypothetical protein
MIPACRALGTQCQQLAVTLRVADLADDGPVFHDAIATWLLGHSERIAFGTPHVEGDWLLVDATIRVPCRHLQAGGQGSARCQAHGFAGRMPRAHQAAPPVRQVGTDQFVVVQGGTVRQVRLLPMAPPRGALPVFQGDNPCAGAPCRTADNRRGAACCRDLTVDVVAPPGDDEAEALLRSRRAPYLCKVTRSEPAILECEVISACGYLAGDGVSCVLHGRTRPDGAPAKPSICSDWPDPGPDDRTHPGCRLVPTVMERA